MAIIWLVEKDIHISGSLHGILAGNFAIRVISSIENLNRILKIETHFLPDIIIFQNNFDNKDCQNIFSVIYDKLPSCKILTNNFITNTCNYNNYKYNMNTSLLDHIRKLLNLDFSNKIDQSISYKDITYDRKNLTLTKSPCGEQEKLPVKEAMLLDIFLEHRTKCISREDIQKYVWNNVKVNSRTIDSHISRLRKKISSCEIVIESIYGGGYILR